MVFVSPRTVRGPTKPTSRPTFGNPDAAHQPPWTAWRLRPHERTRPQRSDPPSPRPVNTDRAAPPYCTISPFKRTLPNHHRHRTHQTCAPTTYSAYPRICSPSRPGLTVDVTPSRSRRRLSSRYRNVPYTVPCSRCCSLRAAPQFPPPRSPSCSSLLCPRLCLRLRLRTLTPLPSLSTTTTTATSTAASTATAPSPPLGRRFPT